MRGTGRISNHLGLCTACRPRVEDGLIVNQGKSSLRRTINRKAKLASLSVRIASYTSRNRPIKVADRKTEFQFTATLRIRNYGDIDG